MRPISKACLYKIEQCRKSRKLSRSGKTSAVFNFIQTHSRHARRLLSIRGRYRKATEPRLNSCFSDLRRKKGRFGLAPSKSAGRGRAMLTQQSPSAITTKMLCPVCGDCLRLTVVEPHYNGKRLDNHIFACSVCNEIQTYVFDRSLSVSRPLARTGLGGRA
jgi:hypothetical protein